ncbi:MAG: hypothetical protein U0Z26_19795 [Anaerolineales bacterium]
MKTSHILGTATLVILILAIASVVMAFSQPVAPTTNIYSSSIQAQATLQPNGTDLSEVGSTDGIMMMGLAIFVIIIIPIIFRKKKK